MNTITTIPVLGSPADSNVKSATAADSMDRLLSSDAAVALRHAIAWSRARRRRLVSAMRRSATNERRQGATGGHLGPGKPHALRGSGASGLAQFWSSAGDMTTLSVRERAALLAAAADAGAPETALILARSLVTDLSSLGRPTLARVLPPMLDALSTAGERGLAAQVRRTFTHGLTRRSDSVCSFDSAAPTRAMTTATWMLGRHVLNSYLISQFLEQVGTVPHSLHEALRCATLQFLTAPEAELLLASVRSREPSSTATAWEAPVNRLLGILRLPALSCAGFAPNVLSTLRCKSPAALRSERGPLVSVIMSAYNAEQTVGYALDSVLAQTYENIEILVCDDASTDGTLALLKGRYGHHPRVRIFASESNQGPYNCRNGLFPYVGGTYVTFHDADDFALPVRIAAQVEAMTDESARACVTDWVRVSPGGVFVFYRDLAAVRLCLPSLMVERSLVDELSGFRRARFGADREFYDRVVSRLGSAGVARIRKPLVFGLSQGGSLTRTDHGRSAADGYRSPARRYYLEACARQRVLGEQAIAHETIDRVLAASGNLCAPAAVHPVGC